MKRVQDLTGTKEMPVRYHIRELRGRLTWVALFFFAGGVAGYTYQVHIINFLRHYMTGSLYYTSPAGNFNFIMKIAVMAGILAAVPALIYHLIKFAQPALSEHHQYKRVWLVTALSFCLAILGMAFAMWVILPISLHFFAGFSINGVQPLISADEYLNYVVKAITWFAVLFQIPLLLLFVNRVTPLPPRMLLKYERHVIVLALVIAVILPFTYDPITQFIIALPIVVLYNFSILLIWLSGRAERRRAVHKVTQSTHIRSMPVQSAGQPQPRQLTPRLSTAKATQAPRLSTAQPRIISDFGQPTRRPIVKQSAAQASRAAVYNRQAPPRLSHPTVTMDILPLNPDLAE